VQISEAGAADDLLQDRVREATNAALTAAQAEAHGRLSAVAAEMGLPTPSAGQLPGMGM
jgi:DNA-binding protein YbaB